MVYETHLKPRLSSLLTVVILALCSESRADTSTPSSQTEAKPKVEATKLNFPPIREFDLDTIGKLGREIYRHDKLAWIATDVLFAQQNPAKYQAEGGCGWVIDTTGAEPLVRFLRKPKLATIEEAAYDINFPKDGKPVLTIPTNRMLTEHQIASRAALATAMAPFNKREYPLCRVVRGGYNYVVLDDPTGPGLLVYLLRPKDTSDSIPVGGHYRISVSADGKTIKQVDRLSASCLALDKRDSRVPAGGKVVGYVTSHVVSNTPVETHVFVAL